MIVKAVQNNKLLTISLFAYAYLSGEMLFLVDEEMMRLRDYGYLAGTTFGLFAEKWSFPSWVYAPWYYMICAYSFGPIFFIFAKLDFISIRTAATLTYHSANVIIHIIGLVGVMRFSKIFNFEKKQTNLFASFFLLFPFFTKQLYQPCVEVLVVACLPWIFYYYIKISKQKKKISRNLIKLSLIFGLAASSKISLMIPLIIFLLIFSFSVKSFLKSKFFLFSIFVPIICLLFFLILSKILIGNWLWENSDAQNYSRGFAGIPDLKIFFNFDIFEAWKADLRQEDPKDSMWNFWVIDFFADQSQAAFLRPHLNSPNNYIVFKYRVGIVFTLIFIFYYLSHLIFFLSYELKKLSHKNNLFFLRLFFVLSFFLIIPETIAYTFAVYSKFGGNWDLRYWTIYSYPMIFLIIINLAKINSFFIKFFNIYFLYLILLVSFFQRTNLSMFIFSN
jgi:hypothetical protein